MYRSNKKGFTIVELVVVIAVVAILAAVLIPTFASLVKKANASKDTQLVRDLNTAIAVYVNEALEGDETTIADALAAAAEFGYDIGKINAKADGNEILWDSVNHVFCYFNENEVQYVPEFAGKTEVTNNADFWVIANAPSETYSTYLVDYEGTTVTAIHSLDVTACGTVDVVYEGSATVAITLAGGNLTVKGGTVKQYGEVRFLDVVAGNCDKNGDVVADLAEVEKVEDTSEWTVVTTADELAAALLDGGKILLGANISVTNEINEKANSFEVKKDTEINLNGFNITGVHTNNIDTLNKNNVLIDVANAELTLSGYGVVSLKYEGTNMQWNALSATLRLSGSTGTINVNDAVVVEHLGGTPMSFAIDAYSSNNSNTLNVNGGALYSSYIAVRWFYPNTTNAKINVTGGMFFGTSRDIWFQGATVDCADIITIADSYNVTVDGVSYYID